MLQSIRRSLAVPQVPSLALATTASVASFGWLLAHDLIAPIFVYLLELYLAF